MLEKFDKVTDIAVFLSGDIHCNMKKIKLQ